jgi:hypothetical protein
VQPPCLEYCELEYREIEFSLCKKDDYPPLCIIKGIDNLENEYIDYDLTGELLVESQVTSNHLLEDEHIEKLDFSDLIVNKNVDSR